MEIVAVILKELMTFLICVVAVTTIGVAVVVPIALAVRSALEAVEAAFTKKEKTAEEKTAEEKTAEEKTAEEIEMQAAKERLAVWEIVEKAEKEIDGCTFRKEGMVIYHAAIDAAWKVTENKQIVKIVNRLYEKATKMPECVKTHVRINGELVWSRCYENGNSYTESDNKFFFIDGYETIEINEINAALEAATYTRVYKFKDFELTVIKTHD